MAVDIAMSSSLSVVFPSRLSKALAALKTFRPLESKLHRESEIRLPFVLLHYSRVDRIWGKSQLPVCSLLLRISAGTCVVG